MYKVVLILVCMTMCTYGEWVETVEFTDVATINKGDAYGEVSVNDGAVVIMSGGSIYYLDCSGGMINIRDGYIAHIGVRGQSDEDDAVLYFSGGQIGEWIAFSFNPQYTGPAAMHFYGYNLHCDPVRVSGTWANGEDFLFPFINWNPFTNHIILHELPDPPCDDYPLSDANKDCRVDLEDLAIMASEWLTCNLEPAEACW